jgi:hypothetical protein
MGLLEVSLGLPGAGLLALREHAGKTHDASSTSTATTNAWLREEKLESITMIGSTSTTSQKVCEYKLIGSLEFSRRTPA